MLRHQTKLVNYKAVSIKYYECVSILVLVTRQANLLFFAPYLYYVVICDLSGSNVGLLFHIIS
jgi:hypothetical protein